MTALPHLGIGIGAPGLGALPPSPGATTIVTVRTERDFTDGHRSDDTHTYTWHGFTAKEAMKHRIERLKEAGRDYSRDGHQITTTIDRGEWLETTTYRYEDGAA